MIIGIPKEIKTRETRVSMRAEDVKGLTANGHTVLVEKDAGLLSGMRDKVYEAIEEHCLYIGSKYGIRLALKPFGRQAATHLMLSHPFVRSVYSILKALELHPHITPANTEITVSLSKGLPSVTLGMTTGENPLLPECRLDISPISTGLTQLLMLIDSVEKGYCNEKTE